MFIDCSDDSVTYKNTASVLELDADPAGDVRCCAHPSRKIRPSGDGSKAEEKQSLTDTSLVDEPVAMERVVGV